MLSKILFWSGFGLAVRCWQLGIQMRPFLEKQALLGFPVFIFAGGSFGYWLEGKEQQANRILAERRHNLLEKRKRRAEREGTTVEGRVAATAGAHETAVGTGGSGGADQI